MEVEGEGAKYILDTMYQAKYIKLNKGIIRYFFDSAHALVQAFIYNFYKIPQNIPG